MREAPAAQNRLAVNSAPPTFAVRPPLYPLPHPLVPFRSASQAADRLGNSLVDRR
jgi:hypothetical protein